MKIRIEAEPAKALAFIQAHDYPYEWHLETFRDYCITLRVEEGTPPDTVAYIWCTWEAPGVLDFHACSKRRLWLSRELIDRLYTIAELFGAHTLTTPGPTPVTRRLLHKLGFTREGMVMQKKLELPYGLPEPEDSEADPDADPAAGARPGDGDDAGRG